MRVLLVVTVLALLPAIADAAPAKKKRASKKAPRATQSSPVTEPSNAPVPVPSTPVVVPVTPPSPFGATAKIKVVVMDLRAASELPADFVGSLSALIAQELEHLGPFAAIASQDVLQMVTFESMRQSLGCDSGASCLAEIGGALGADYMVSGNLSLVGGSYLLQLQLMDLSASNITARVARDYSGPPSALLDEVRVATRMLVRDILGKRSGRLVVSAVEEGATVAVDDVVVGVTPLREPLTLGAGTHTVTIDKRGFVRFAKDVVVSEGADTRVDVLMQPSDEFIREYRERARFQRRLAWAGMITGGVALVAGGVLYAKGASDASDLARDIEAYNASGLRDSGTASALADRDASIGRLDTGALIAAGVGVAALTTGIVLFVTGDDPDQYEPKTHITPNVTLDGKGGALFVFSGRF